MNSPDVMCNGHKFVKTALFSSSGYLADLSPYISAVISSRMLATPIQLTTSAIKPLAPIAQSILPTIATNFILSGTLTCEYCLHQVNQDNFDDGKICPFQLLEQLGLSDDSFVLAEDLLDAQERRRVDGILKSFENSGASNTTSYKSTDESTTTTQSDSTAPNWNKPSPKAPSSSTQGSRKNHLDSPQSHRNDILIMRICPEVGIHQQRFTCVDCDKKITFATSRLCDYDGRYYCFECHTGYDIIPIPARIVKNWDFTPRSVSISSMQKISFLRSRPVLFNLFQMNSMLYGFIDKLVEIKQVRQRIHSMLKYILVCGQPNRPNLVSVPKHLQRDDFLNLFTLNDLFDINKLYEYLVVLQTNLESHIIRECESCRGKGFYCELCKDSRDIIYPFSKNASICAKCKTVYHKNCFHRKKLNCPRCTRITSIKDNEEG